MNAVSVFPAAPSFDSFGNREADPMPETKTRRTIKSNKAYIARLKRQIKAEERRIRLQEESSYLESKLSFLRETVGTSSYNGR